MAEQPKQNWEIFIRYIKGELPGDKERELKEFLSENPDMEKYADDMKMLAGELPRIKPLSADQISEKYSRLADGIKAAERRARRRKVWIGISGAAAAVAIAMLVYNIRPVKTEEPIAMSVDNLVPSHAKKIEVVLETGDTVRFDHKTQITLPNAVIDHDEMRYTGNAVDVTEAPLNTICVPNGVTFKTVLSDGTVVYLNSDSQLKFPVVFRDAERRVELLGEAYFEVTPDKEKPFVVATPNQKIDVLGTSFNVMAYQQESKESVVLVSGSVKLSAGGDSPLIMQPGEMATLPGSGHYELEKVNVRNYTAWKDGTFIFNRMPLEDIMARLARWYDVDIRFADEEARKLHFTGAVERERQLSYALEMIRATTQIEFESDGQSIVISKK